MTQAERYILQLETAVLDELQPVYADALTAMMKGGDAGPHWARFRQVFIRAWIVSGLVGRMDVVNKLKSSGIRFKIDNPPVKESEFVQYAVPGTLITAPFAEAINLFREKVPALRRVVDQLTRQAKAKSFWITGIESTDALAAIQKRIGRALEAVPASEGGERGMSGMIDDAIEDGAEMLSRARLETVIRTNLSQAQAEGVTAQLSEPDIQDQTALWVLHEVHDRRTRGNPSGLYPDAGPHWQMDWFIERPNAPVWNKIGWPGPAGYCCRRSLSLMTWATAKANGFANADRTINQAALDRHNGKRWDYIDSGAYPDKGFGA